MNRFHLMLCCILLMAFTLALALIRPEPLTGHGIPHPRYPSMSEGGDAARHQGLHLIGWLFAGSQIVLFTLCLTLGLKSGTKAIWSKWLAIVTLLYLAVLSALVLSYAIGAAGTLFAMPVSTALLIPCLWAVPLLFTWLYVRNFSQWVYGPEEAKRFEELKLEHKRESSNG